MGRSEQREQSREALLDGAAAEFARVGYEGTRIQGILDQAGASRGGLYHHFKLKEQIADALAEAEVSRWPQLQADVLAEHRGLEGLVVFFGRAAAVVRDEVRARAMLRIDSERGTPLGRRAVDVWQELATLLLRQAIADGAVPAGLDAGAIAGIAVASLYGACLSPTVPALPDDLEERADRVVRLLLSAVQNA